MRITSSLSSTEAVAKMAAKYPAASQRELKCYISCSRLNLSVPKQLNQECTKTTFKYDLFH